MTKEEFEVYSNDYCETLEEIEFLRERLWLIEKQAKIEELCIPVLDILYEILVNQYKAIEEKFNSYLRENYELYIKDFKDHDLLFSLRDKCVLVSIDYDYGVYMHSYIPYEWLFDHSLISKFLKEKEQEFIKSIDQGNG